MSERHFTQLITNLSGKVDWEADSGWVKNVNEVVVFATPSTFVSPAGIGTGIRHAGFGIPIVRNMYVLGRQQHHRDRVIPSRSRARPGVGSFIDGHAPRVCITSNSVISGV